MNELPLEKAKQIVAETPSVIDRAIWPYWEPGRRDSLFKFTLMAMETEILSIPDLDRIERSKNNIMHLSGRHKAKYSPMKASELRHFWGMNWELLGTFPHVHDYIIAVCETHHRAGNASHPWGLGGLDFIGSRKGGKPWRTDEWLAAQRALTRRQAPPPLTEFYPYIAANPTEEHEFLIAVDSLVPKYLPNATRADVCQDMIVAILTGDVTLDNLRDGLPKYLKMFMKGSPSKYGHLSLDAPVGYGDERTLAQKLGL